VAQTAKQDILANNIANAQTPGFKRQKAVTVSFAQELDNRLANTLKRDRPPYPDSPVAPVTVQVTDWVDGSQGPIKQTGNKLDFAIDGPGMFEVESGGQTYHTRAGNFRLGSDGELCTADGARVLGESGPIKLPEGDWSVASDGSITADGSTVGKIRIVGAQDGATTIHQGSLEQANVNIVREMVDMIVNMRSYEANQKVLASVDGSLERLINDVGKV
jgi:flagellar basal-body rod protein FlgG